MMPLAEGLARQLVHDLATQVARKAAVEQAMRDRRLALAERSWMNRKQRRAADRGVAS